MKEFAVYTVLRLLLLAGTFGITVGIWSQFSDRPTQGEVLAAIVIAFVVSGIASYFVLDPYRQRFAAKVEARASKAASRFEERKAVEDGEPVEETVVDDAADGEPREES